MNKKFLGSFAVLALLIGGTASAVPCGYYGVEPSSNCVDGIGQQDSAAVINAGAFFGASNWELLDRVDTHGDRSNTEFWLVSGAARGLPAGTFALADGIWTKYKKLAVALKGGGAQAVGGPVNTPMVNWSLYQLVPGQTLYDWVYGATRTNILRDIFTATIYGTVATVAEPSSLGLLMIGGVALAAAGRRRGQAAVAA